MRNPYIPALAVFVLAIICAAGAIYSAIVDGIYYPNGATLGTGVAAITAGYLWWRADENQTETERQEND